jgi:hypothetical protein
MDTGETDFERTSREPLVSARFGRALAGIGVVLANCVLAAAYQYETVHSLGLLMAQTANPAAIGGGTAALIMSAFVWLRFRRCDEAPGGPPAGAGGVLRDAVLSFAIAGVVHLAISFVVNGLMSALYV